MMNILAIYSIALVGTLIILSILSVGIEKERKTTTPRDAVKMFLTLLPMLLLALKVII